MRPLFEGRDHIYRRDDKGKIIAMYNSICSSIKGSLRSRGLDIVLPRHLSEKEMLEYWYETLQNTGKPGSLKTLEKYTQGITLDKMRAICDAIVRGDRVLNGKSGYVFVSEWLENHFSAQQRKSSTELIRERAIKVQSVKESAELAVSSTYEVLESARVALKAVLPETISVKMLVETIDKATPKYGEEDESFDVRTVIAGLLASTAPEQEAAAAAARPAEHEEDDWEAFADEDAASAVPDVVSSIFNLYTAYNVAKIRYTNANLALQRLL